MLHDALRKWKLKNVVGVMTLNGSLQEWDSSSQSVRGRGLLRVYVLQPELCITIIFIMPT